MRHSLVTLLIAVGLAACSGGESAGTTAPPPAPPPPAIARVVLVPDAGSILLHLNGTLPVTRLVDRVLDVHGDSVPRALVRFAITAPAPWIVRGDTLVAPATEVRSAITISASYRASAVRAVGLSFDAASFDGTPADTAIDATAAVDLRAHRWRASWRCVSRPEDRNIPHESVDSVHITADSMSITYPGEAGADTTPGAIGWVANQEQVAQLAMRMHAIQWIEDGTVKDTMLLNNSFAVTRQLPDSIEMLVSGVIALTRQSADGAPLVYGGASWCSSEWRAERGLVTLEEY